MTTQTRIVCRFFLLVGLCLCAYRPSIGAPEDLQRGIQAYWNAEYTKAEALLLSASSDDLHPDERVIVKKYLAYTYVAQGKEDNAVLQFSSLLDLSPSFSLKTDEVSPKVRTAFQKATIQYASRMSDDGRKAYLEGNYRSAVGYFEKALLADPQQPLAREFLSLAQDRVKAEGPPVPSEPEKPKLPAGLSGDDLVVVRAAYTKNAMCEPPLTEAKLYLHRGDYCRDKMRLCIARRAAGELSPGDQVVVGLMHTMNGKPCPSNYSEVSRTKHDGKYCQDFERLCAVTISLSDLAPGAAVRDATLAVETPCPSGFVERSLERHDGEKGREPIRLCLRN